MMITEGFQTPLHMKEMMENLIDHFVDELNKEHDLDYIPPIVYSQIGRAFNVHYNFLISSIARTFDDESVYSDFAVLPERRAEDTEKLALFLICSIFENWYGLVRINSRTIDIAKYKSAKSLDIPLKYSNDVCYKSEQNFTRFRAIPMNEISLKKMISEEHFIKLQEATTRYKVEQVSFGAGQYQALINKLGAEEIPYHS